MKKKHVSGYWRLIILFAACAAVLNFMAQFHAFCDIYTDHVFGVAANTYGRLTGLAPFSVGEILIVVGLLLTIAVIPACVALVFPRERMRAAARRYLKAYLAVILVTLLLMTLNCTIPYNCSRLNVNGNREKVYGRSEISELRNYIVAQCNELSRRMTRDEAGYAVYEGDEGEMNVKVRSVLADLAERYPRFSNYSPRPKELWGSFFMYQTHMIGIYFPFSMEANYNGYLYELYYPFIACHELSHLKGYMYEDEADFMAYLATAECDDDFFRYSAFVNVLWYIESDYRDAVPQEERAGAPEISDTVRRDANCYREDTLEKLRSHEQIIPTERMTELGDAFTESYLEYYGVEANYHEVTKLLLQYYDGILYDTGDT